MPGTRKRMDTRSDRTIHSVDIALENACATHYEYLLAVRNISKTVLLLSAEYLPPPVADR